MDYEQQERVFKMQETEREHRHELQMEETRIQGTLVGIGIGAVTAVLLTVVMASCSKAIF